MKSVHRSAAQARADKTDAAQSEPLEAEIRAVDELHRSHQRMTEQLSGVIVGRALYEGRVDLREALRVGESPGVLGTSEAQNRVSEETYAG